MKRFKEEKGSAITVVIVLMIIVLIIMAVAIGALIYLIKTNGDDSNKDDKNNKNEIAINISNDSAFSSNSENVENLETNTQVSTPKQISPLIGTSKVITEQEFVANLKGIEKYTVTSQILNGITSNIYEYVGVYSQDNSLFGVTITLKQVNNQNEITLKFDSEVDSIADKDIVGLNVVMSGIKSYNERYSFQSDPTYTGVKYNNKNFIVVDTMKNGLGSIIVRESPDTEFQEGKLINQ